MVPAAWRAFERQQKIHSWNASDLERFRLASELRRVLETTSHALHPNAPQSAEFECCWLVGPGRLLRPDEDLRNPGKGRSQPPKLPRRRSLEPWRLGPRRGQLSRTDSFRQRYSALFPPKHRSALVCLLA